MGDPLPRSKNSRYEVLALFHFLPSLLVVSEKREYVQSWKFGATVEKS
jgi:hypothetical protein